MVVDNWDVDQSVGFSRSDHLVYSAKEPDLVGTKFPIIVGVENRYVPII
jgi:hypothetical protein